MSTLLDGPATTDGPPAPAPELAGLRVLLVHHWLYTWAGSERVLEQLLALMPHADILAGMVTPEMRGRNEVARRARESWAGKIPGARTQHRWFLPAHAVAFRTYDTSSYDLIVSVSHAFEKAIRARKPGARHVCYCLTPPRYLWDLAASHDRLARPIERVALAAARAALRAADRRFATSVDHFVSLSRHVAQRVHRAYGRNSTVVYPPVTMKPAPATRERQQFLLSLGRLVPYKRVDLAVRAATMLGLPLLVAGEGPERRRLERMAGPTVRFLGQVSEDEAGRLLSSCAAFVFCAEEDFGIAPVEANAHGAPVVAYGAGGGLETIREDESGVFFREENPDAVAEAIARCLRAKWDEPLLRANAERFSADRFRVNMRAELAAALEGGTA